MTPPVDIAAKLRELWDHGHGHWGDGGTVAETCDSLIAELVAEYERLGTECGALRAAALALVDQMIGESSSMRASSRVWDLVDKLRLHSESKP